MDSVLRAFDPEDNFTNDLIVNRFVERHFNVELNLFDVNWQIHQLNRSYT